MKLSLPDLVGYTKADTPEISQPQSRILFLPASWGLLFGPTIPDVFVLSFLTTVLRSLDHVTGRDSDAPRWLQVGQFALLSA